MSSMFRIKKWRSFCISVACCFCVYFMTQELRHYQKVSPSPEFTSDVSTTTLDRLGYISRERLVGDGDSFLKHAFNVQSSNSIPMDRTVPDSRHTNCRNRPYRFPRDISVSVVISFHNEARSALLRTITSVINKSPGDLLKEIILIDDFSDNANDGRELTLLQKIKVIRNDRREGLVRSRMKGAKIAYGTHIMFMDSHCEVNIGWMEPLLQILVKHPRALACPVIDMIDTDSFVYKPSSGQLKGGFDWNLNFRWDPVTTMLTNEIQEPIEFKSPVIPGGLFLVEKAWFQEIGGLNENFEIWGAENIEVSIKSWLCGGQVLGVPCSRIGHVFRARHPYGFPPNGSMATYLRNSRLLAENWLEEYKQQFYNLKPQAKSVSVSRHKGVVNLKKKLKCKPFQWFLDNVYPELKPLVKDAALALGQLRQENTCLQSKNDKQNRTSVELAQCSINQPNQEWMFSKSGMLQQAQNCLTIRLVPSKPKIYLSNCKNKAEQQWTRRRRLLIATSTGHCLENIMDPLLGSSYLTLTPCRKKAFSQQWDFSVELQAWGDR